MEQAELDIALEELELRLERLRGLYEQYFLGLEKIEPSVARKDVDRRIYVLRREKIRNTAKRFKLQTVIQRYNTFQQYWQRICREIENGTYKRHLLRAQKIGGGELLTIAAKRRLGRATRASTPPADKPPESVAHASAAADSAPAPESPAPAPAPAPAPGSPPPPPRARPPLPPPATRAAGRASETAAKAPPAPAATAPLPPPPKAFESLDLDMDFMGEWDPGKRPAPVRPAKQVAAPAPPAPAARPAPAPAPRAAPPVRSPVEAPPPKPAARPAKPAAPATAPAAAGVDDTRLRDLHARLQQAKQQTKEGSVSFDGLAKSIRATEAKLRAQHKDRKIEFDVVIKDGRAVVKPIVR